MSSSIMLVSLRMAATRCPHSIVKNAMALSCTKNCLRWPPDEENNAMAPWMRGAAWRIVQALESQDGARYAPERAVTSHARSARARVEEGDNARVTSPLSLPKIGKMCDHCNLLMDVFTVL